MRRYFSFLSSFIKAGHIAIIIKRNGKDAAIDIVCNALMLPADSSTYANAASITAQATFLYLGALIFPSDVIMLKEYVAESADVIKKIASKQIIIIDITLLNGYLLNTIKTAVSGEAARSFTVSKLKLPAVLKAIVPKTDSQIMVKAVGISTTPIMNSFIVLPLEILAINIPTNGVHAMNHA